MCKTVQFVFQVNCRGQDWGPSFGLHVADIILSCLVFAHSTWLSLCRSRMVKQASLYFLVICVCHMLMCRIWCLHYTISLLIHWQFGQSIASAAARMIWMDERFVYSSLLVLYLPRHSTHDWRPNSLSYPIPIPLLRHCTSTIITDCNRSPVLGLGLTLILTWQRNEKIGYCGLDLK